MENLGVELRAIDGLCVGDEIRGVLYGLGGCDSARSFGQAGDAVAV